MQEANLRQYQPEPVQADQVKHIHLIGIAGTGMGTLAGMLKQAGYHITGSDQGIYPPMSHQLEAWKIPVQEGFAPAHLEPRPDLVIVGNACRPSNQEVQAAMAQNIPCTSMPRAIHDFFLKGRHVVVVAGTHGKTTTTALTGWLLHHAGHKPGILVGGVCANFNGSFVLPEGDCFVIEGDEYDSALFDKVPKFIHYAPRSVILTSVEFDHADIYDDLDAVKKAFRQLMHRIPKNGHLYVCGDYEHALDVAKLAQSAKTTYGTSPGKGHYAKDIDMAPEGAKFTLCRKNAQGQEQKIGDFVLPMFGRFNITNAVAAISIALQFGVSVDKIQEGLLSFKGIKRRQEIVGEIDDLRVIDDFAHHPTAIQATTEAIKERYQDRRLWGIFEPRSNTARRHFFQDLLPRSFDACDQVLLSFPYRHDKMDADERLNIEKVIDDLQARGKKAIAFHEVDEIVAYVTAKARPDDIVVVMSNGGFGGIHGKLTEALQHRFERHKSDQ